MNATTDSATNHYQRLTGTGPSAIAVVALSGTGVPEFAERHIRMSHSLSTGAFPPGTVARAALLDDDGSPIDDILFSVHAAGPAWQARLHLHGSPWIVNHCEKLLRSAGFSPAEQTLWPAADEIMAETYALLPAILTERGVCWLLEQANRLRQIIRQMLAAATLDDAPY